MVLYVQDKSEKTKLQEFVTRYFEEVEEEIRQRDLVEASKKWLKY